MLKKENRLSPGLLSGARTLTSPLFSVKIAPNKMDKNRFVFIVSKKIDKRATARNSLKRKVRSCIEQIFDNIKAGFDFVFYPKALAIKTEREEILSEINKVFLKNNLLKRSVRQTQDHIE